MKTPAVIGRVRVLTAPLFSTWPERMPGRCGPDDKPRTRKRDQLSPSRAPSAGGDIGKDHLDACLHPSGEARRLANDTQGHRALVAWLTSHGIARVVFEATGPYHRALERALAAAGLAAAKVNPRQARRFAEAVGRLAKTDRSMLPCSRALAP